MVISRDKLAERALPSLFVEKFFQFLILLLFFVALLWGQKHLIYLAVLILAMINGAKVWCRLSARGFRAAMEIDRQRAFPGEKILLRCRVESGSLLPIWLQTEIPLAQGFFIACGTNILSGDGGLMWREKMIWDWELAAPKRGFYRIGPLSLVTGDLLGFFQQRKEAMPALGLTVFPRLVPLRPLPLSLREFFGEQRGKSPIEDPVYPVATRDYRLGRPARHIHWKASLRHNRLQEKVFEHTLRKKILLAIDVEGFQKHEDKEGFEAALEAAASLAVQLDAEGCSTGIISNCRTFLPRDPSLPLSRGGEHLQSLLERLAILRLEAKEPLVGILRRSPDFFRDGMGLYFAYQGGREVLDSAEIFQQNNIPAVFVLKNFQDEYLEKTGHRVFNLQEIHGGEAGA